MADSLRNGTAESVVFKYYENLAIGLDDAAGCFGAVTNCQADPARAGGAATASRDVLSARWEGIDRDAL